jgi:outer membrane protein insertion porin family
MVSLDQNRVDIVFEIQEGPKSKVRQINIIGNEAFDDGDLRGEMVTKQASLTRIFSSGTSYDPDRMAFDQQKLRQFYLTKGYADFRIVSAVAELTPDKKDFILTYVVEEGPRFKFGEVKVESQLRDFDSDRLATQLPMKAGDWYDAKMVEDTIEKLNETLGAFGYAFADIRPDYARDKDALTMGLVFQIAEAPRVYVEKIDVNGNTLTQDKVIRREFRLAEGDAFNSLQVKRSTARINSLGYFQEKFEVEQKPGSAPDRIILEANVEEKPTGELQLSAGYSSLEKLIFQGSIQQRNFRGRGQTVGISLAYSNYSKQVDLSFTEPYVFDKNVSLGVNLYRRDLNSFNYFGNERNTVYKQATTGFQVRAGVPLTEYVSAIGSYTFNYDDVSVARSQYFTDRQNPPELECDPIIAGRYLCDALGKRTSSILGLSLVHDSLDNRVRPSRGRVLSVSTDFAGLGGSVKYARLRANAAQYFPMGKGFIFSLRAEGGVIKGLSNRGGAGIDDVRLTDRFYLGEPQMRGFDIRGLGPRIIRKSYIDTNGDGVRNGATSLCFRADDPATTGTNEGFAQLLPTQPTGQNPCADAFPLIAGVTTRDPDAPDTDRSRWFDDALGGRFYYLARAEMEIPLGSGARELGLRPSIFVDAGAVWGVKAPSPQNQTTDVFIATRDRTTGAPLYFQVNTVTQTATTCTIATSSQVPDATNTIVLPCLPTGVTQGVNTALGQTYPAFVEEFLGNSPKPRVSIGIGVNWNSPFGPFRIDFAKTLLKVKGDDTKAFTFNVGTQF